MCATQNFIKMCVTTNFTKILDINSVSILDSRSDQI